MAEPGDEVRCPTCARIVPVPPDWRLAVCPSCGEVITRMTADATYD